MVRNYIICQPIEVTHWRTEWGQPAPAPALNCIRMHWRPFQRIGRPFTVDNLFWRRNAVQSIIHTLAYRFSFRAHAQFTYRTATATYDDDAVFRPDWRAPIAKAFVKSAFVWNEDDDTPSAAATVPNGILEALGERLQTSSCVQHRLRLLSGTSALLLRI